MFLGFSLKRFLKMNDQEMYNFARWIALALDLEEQDGWFNVRDIVDIDGSPWVNSQDLIRIFNELSLTIHQVNV